MKKAMFDSASLCLFMTGEEEAGALIKKFIYIFLLKMNIINMKKEIFDPIFFASDRRKKTLVL